VRERMAALQRARPCSRGAAEPDDPARNPGPPQQRPPGPGGPRLHAAVRAAGGRSPARLRGRRSREQGPL